MPSLTFKSLPTSLRATRFNTFYMVLALRWVFYEDIRTGRDICFKHHQLIGFYNRGRKCLLRGTEWFLILSTLRLVFKSLIPTLPDRHFSFPELQKIFRKSLTDVSCENVSHKIPKYVTCSWIKNVMWDMQVSLYGKWRCGSVHSCFWYKSYVGDLLQAPGASLPSVSALSADII